MWTNKWEKVLGRVVVQDGDGQGGQVTGVHDHCALGSDSHS
jgi:hypothetical protein